MAPMVVMAKRIMLLAKLRFPVGYLLLRCVHGPQGSEVLTIYASSLSEMLISKSTQKI
jgi:hypothetical protein